MPSCECCYSQVSPLDADTHKSYRQEMKRHEERACECTNFTLEGARLRAGQFWEDGRDRRYTVEEWGDYVASIEAIAKAEGE